MNFLKARTFYLILLIALFPSLSIFAAPINIPLGGNAYIIKSIEGAKITDNGISEWKDASTIISSWFRINQIGELNLSIRAKAYASNTQIQIKVDGKTYPLTLSSKEWTIYPIANGIPVNETGYLRIDIQGTNKQGEYFADLSDLVIDGTAIEAAPNYVKDFSYYFGRRGPSVHLKYPFPKEDIEYFYNEVTVPEGDDVIGSYYMANGFGQGYFGMQVNSETERRMLFSVWSPFDTQDPKDIPADQQIKKLRQGKDVHIGEFGNEGSGGQSYLKYSWKAGTTYKFLTQIHPDGKGNTIYTAYFYTPEEGQWKLIASFLRPQTNTWYTNAHSFLENFIPNQGYITRKVLFGNQWVVTTKGKWVEITNAIFTYDATAKAEVRTDYAGGEGGKNQFYLQNCGFFDKNTTYNTSFSRKAENKKPSINFKQLNSIK